MNKILEYRQFNGYNCSHVNHDLKIVVNIVNCGTDNRIKVKKQIEEFKRMTGNSRALFFIYKKFLLGETDTIGNQKSQKMCEGKECWFCKKTEKLIVHHIDMNRKNNNKENLVRLCSFCHKRLHNILKKYNKVQYSMKV